VAAGHNSDIFVCGKFTGPADFDPDGGCTETSDGFEDCYLTKYLSDGSWQWVKTYGGPNNEDVYDAAVNQFGDIFLTGHFDSTCNFNPDGVSNQTSVGQHDAYISKFNDSGQWQIAKIWGGLSNDIGTYIAVDYHANAYVGGNYNETANFDPDGNETHTSAGSFDCFLLKLKY